MAIRAAAVQRAVTTATMVTLDAAVTARWSAMRAR